jgi:hypothetical protein
VRRLRGIFGTHISLIGKLVFDMICLYAAIDFAIILGGSVV